MKASDIIVRASRTILDRTNVRWPVEELLDYINDGQQVIILLRPDANAKNENMQLVGGTLQAIPAMGMRLLRVIRNMGNDGKTPGRSVRPASREALDNELPDWHFTGATRVVEHYVFDNMDPAHFYVYPPCRGEEGAKQGQYLNIVYSAAPARADDAQDTLELGDQYLPALVDYVLYRAYTKDSDYAGNVSRAEQHLKSMASTLQVSMQTAFSAVDSKEGAP